MSTAVNCFVIESSRNLISGWRVGLLPLLVGQSVAFLGHYLAFVGHQYYTPKLFSMHTIYYHSAAYT